MFITDHSLTQEVSSRLILSVDLRLIAVKSISLQVICYLDDLPDYVRLVGEYDLQFLAQRGQVFCILRAPGWPRQRKIDFRSSAK